MGENKPKVIVIPAAPKNTGPAEQRQLRVAAYCRVSTKEEDQLNSYEAQKSYYTDKIMLCQSVCSAVNAVHATDAAHGSTRERSTSSGAVSAASTMARNTAMPHPPWTNSSSSKPSCGLLTA